MFIYAFKQELFTKEDEVLSVAEKAILLFRDKGIAGERFSGILSHIGFEEACRLLESNELLARKEEILTSDTKESYISFLTQTTAPSGYSRECTEEYTGYIADLFHFIQKSAVKVALFPCFGGSPLDCHRFIMREKN